MTKFFESTPVQIFYLIFSPLAVAYILLVLMFGIDLSRGQAVWYGSLGLFSLWSFTDSLKWLKARKEAKADGR